jgi:16S rRNA (cytosine1402-N4)-methyltransferase
MGPPAWDFRGETDVRLHFVSFAVLTVKSSNPTTQQNRRYNSPLASAHRFTAHRYEQCPNVINYARQTGLMQPKSIGNLPSATVQYGHDPVLLPEILQILAPSSGKLFVDCTMGRGGHSSAIAQRLGPSGLLIGLDADPRNLEFARERLRDAPCPVRFFHANFAELSDVLKIAGHDRVDGILADLGLSTNQLFDAQYGLSFSQPMPLDMRIDPRTEKTAADLVNHLKEEELANVLYELAQERYSRRIARKIVEARKVSPIKTTDRLADLVRSAIPVRPGKRGARSGAVEIDPATRTFLARHLNRGGRLAVISFQSTEDRMVKQAFRSAEQTGLVKIITPKPLSPADPEIAANPRSRSAKLRAAEVL